MQPSSDEPRDEPPSSRVLGLVPRWFPESESARALPRERASRTELSGTRMVARGRRAWTPKEAGMDDLNLQRMQLRHFEKGVERTKAILRELEARGPDAR